jgi:hypothetical protein
MSAFTTPLAFRPLPTRREGRPLYALTAPFDYGIGSESSSLRIHVETGFETDFASVPRPLRRWFPPYGPWAKAAVIHDKAYEDGVLSRWMCDLIFLEAMAVLKVPFWRRALMYLAVRAFGWRSFKQA